MAYVWFSAKVEKRPSPIHGLGVFAREAISAGELVMAKGGHVFDRATRDRLAATLGPAEVQIGEHLFMGPTTLEDRDAAMLHLNHSCEPNLGIEGQITYVAMRDIRPGEEVCWDLATADDDDWVMECNCGAPSCRGTITGQDWRRKDLQAKYAGWFASYLARKIAAESAGR